MTEHEAKELARIERDLREIVGEAHERIDRLISFAKWIIGGLGGAGLLVALTTVPWLWILSSSTVVLQTTVAQHTETLAARAAYLQRVDTLEAQVALERARAAEDRAQTAEVVNEIRNALRSIEQRVYERRSPGSRQTRP